MAKLIPNSKSITDFVGRDGRNNKSALASVSSSGCSSTGKRGASKDISYSTTLDHELSGRCRDLGTKVGSRSASYRKLKNNSVVQLELFEKPKLIL